MMSDKPTSKKVKTAVVSVRMPRPLKDEIKQMAEQNFRSLNQQILWLLERGLAAQRAEDGLAEN